MSLDAPQAEAPMRLGVVVPCFNEAEMLPIALPRLLALLEDLEAKKLISSDSFLYFVDDGSADNTWAIIDQAHRVSKRIKAAKLSRNFGHQRALLAGLLNCNADVVVSIDADLQDDLIAVEAMLRARQEGAEIVYGVRSGRENDSWFKRASARGYYRLLKYLGADCVFDHADFRLMSRRALDALAEYGESNLFLRGIVPTLGFRAAIVRYDRVARQAGETKYPLKKMLSLAIAGVTAFSVVPLRLITWTGVVVAMFSIAFGTWALYAYFAGDSVVPGWVSTVVPMYFLGGVQLLALGIIGEYQAKTYLEVKKRPRFLIESLIGD